jgi:lipopolysaccharide export system protein LptA
MRLPYLLTFLSALLFSHWVYAQERQTVEIVNSDLLEFMETPEGKMKILTGNVALRQGNSMLYCDKADFNDESNMVHATGHVHLTKGDSVHLYCNTLDYNGDEKYANAHQQVRLRQGKSTLYTEELHYDLNQSVGRFNTPARLVNDSTTLTSKRGVYNGAFGIATFYQDVRLTDPHFKMQADSFGVDILRKINYFIGLSKIDLDSQKIVCSGGYMDNVNKRTLFTKNASVRSKGQFISGDSIYFDQKQQSGLVTSNGLVYDSVQKLFIRGNEIHLWQNPSRMMATQSSRIYVLLDKDTLQLRGDTLWAGNIPKTKDRYITAYSHVQVWHPELQVACRRMDYFSSDSTFYFTGNPLMWADSTQLSADSILLTTANKKLDRLYLLQHAFMASHVKSKFYQQLSGRKMDGIFSDNHLSLINIFGNALSIYHSQDDKGAFIGTNKAACSTMRINLENNKVKQIRFFGQPESVFSPSKRLSKEELFLKGFTWQSALRPTK